MWVRNKNLGTPRMEGAILGKNARRSLGDNISQLQLKVHKGLGAAVLQGYARSLVGSRPLAFRVFYDQREPLSTTFFLGSVYDSRT